MSNCKNAQRTKAIATEPDSPHSTHRTHMVEGENWFPQTALEPPRVSCDANVRAHTQKIECGLKIIVCYDCE